MDFIIGLPRTQRGYDSIWVIIDRLTKVDHFLPVKTTYTSPQLAALYMERIVCLHGVPKKIVSTQVFGPDVLRDVEEQVRMIRDNLRVAQSQ